jgi:hypothetical protein
MCVICVLWEKDKLTKKEALSALMELVRSDDIDPDHLHQVIETIDDSEE